MDDNALKVGVIGVGALGRHHARVEGHPGAGRPVVGGEHGGGVPDDPAHAGGAVTVDPRGLPHLAQSHRTHLAEAALDGAGDRRMRLDPVDDNDVVGPRCAMVAEDGETVRQLADLIDLHADRDRAAELFLCHAK